MNDLGLRIITSACGRFKSSGSCNHNANAKSAAVDSSCTAILLVGLFAQLFKMLIIGHLLNEEQASTNSISMSSDGSIKLAMLKIQFTIFIQIKLNRVRSDSFIPFKKSDQIILLDVFQNIRLSKIVNYRCSCGYPPWGFV